MDGCPANLYLTGEMSHHDVLACVEKGIRYCNVLLLYSVILTEHSNSERGYLKAVLRDRLTELINIPGQEPLEVIVSAADQDPILIV